MGMRLALFITFVLSAIVLGEKEQKNETVCLATNVDCACTEKDGSFYTIQIYMTTVHIYDEDTVMDRCIADGDPLALCEHHNCVIIPNDNFGTLFPNQKPGPGPSEDVSAPFYPIELTYPRMIHEESSQLVKEVYQPDTDSFMPPPDWDFWGKKYGRKGPSLIPRDPESMDDKYEQNGLDLFKHPTDLDFIDEEKTKKGPDFFWPPSDPDFWGNIYGKDLEDEHESNMSLLSDSKDSLPIPSHPEELGSPQSNERPSFRDQSANNAPTYWVDNYSYRCLVPQLKYSEVTCWQWPDYETCQQICIYGHGIASPKGTLRSITYTCRKSENQWKPHEITDCEAYMNCKVILKSPGDLKCVEPTHGPAYCDIECEDYDNHSAVKVRATCDEKQGVMWLPFCATLDNNFYNKN